MKIIYSGLLLAITVWGCNSHNTSSVKSDWNISVLPSSVRLDPTYDPDLQLSENGKVTIGWKSTDITVCLNGPDESYFPEAWNRMVYYGEIFRQYYPETSFRIDRGYTEEALQIVKNSISSWASHTIEFDYETIRKYQEMGIRVWLYGPKLCESKANSWVDSSTFIDLPLVNDRAVSWSCWKYNTCSWLSLGAGA